MTPRFRSVSERGVLLLLLPLLADSRADADVGTPLIWLKGSHLCFGNLIIGIAEGWLIARVWQRRFKRTAPIMVLANYASMAIGLFLVGGPVLLLYRRLESHPGMLYSLPALLFLLLLLTLAVSVIMEWPFCRWALRSDWRTAIKASLLAQAASYAVLVPLYLLASPISLVWWLDRDAVPRFRQETAGAVLYLQPETRTVWRMDLHTGAREQVADAEAPPSQPDLFLRPSPDAPGWDLWCHERWIYGASEILIPHCVPAGATASIWLNYQGESTPPGPWQAAWLEPGDKKGWDIYAGFWAAEGLHAYNEHGGESAYIAFETPYLELHASYATVLPGEKIIYQLGTAILGVDLRRREAGILTRGVSPIVVLDATP